MDEDRWRRIDALFDEALELPDAGRRALLDRKCSGDPGLRQAVERLLALEQEAGDFLTDPALPGAFPGSETTDPASVDELAGVRIGPYRLVRSLGRGGMGVVYLATREHPYHQEVAIKLVRRSRLSRQGRSRLAAERQALARLEHPNIARLYDGGTTDDGIPYLVLERVVGLPIDRYCDEHRLAIRQRLELLLQVLAAVGLAHHHLRVHCDIKPANILVTADGTPKLLDFGIAKLLSPEEAKAAVTATATAIGRRPMTPAYASPEQILGEPITTACDLYSVGVLLYELLSGHLPYDLDTRPDSDLGRAVVEQDPRPPSRSRSSQQESRTTVTPEVLAERRRLTPRGLEQHLRGDLDAVVLKAIRKEPGERYQSAEAFADDIRRHLDARPVRARRDTWRYRGARFVRRLFFPPDARRRRERWAWAAVLLLVVALSALAWRLRSPPPLCGDAEARLDGAWSPGQHQVVTAAFLGTGLPFARDTAERVVAALDTYAGDWIATDTAICEDTLVRGERSPRLLDLGRMCLDGRREELRSLVDLFSQADNSLVIAAVAAVNQLGDLDACTNQVELAMQQLPPADPAVRQRLARARDVAEAQLLRLEIKLPTDLAALAEAEKEVRELDHPPYLARVLYVHGQALVHSQSESAGGIAKLEEALLAAIEGGDRPLQTRIYAALVKLLARQQGDFERARFWQRFAKASLEALSPGFHDVEFAVLDALGVLSWEFGDISGSMDYYRQALGSAESDGDPMLQVSALSHLGMVSAKQAQRALELLEQELGPDHVSLSNPLMNLAAVRASDGHYAEALALVERTYALRRATWGDEHPDLGFPLTLIGQIKLAQDRPEEALEALQKGLALAEEGLGAGSVIIRDLHVGIAEALILLARLPEARQHLLPAAASFEAGSARDGPSRINFLRVEGNRLREMGEPLKALEVHREMITRMRPLEEIGNSIAAWPLAAAAATLVAAGHHEEARPLLEKSLLLVSAGDRRVAAEIRLGLAEVVAREDPERARRLVGEARGLLSPENPVQRQILEKLEREWGEAG